MKGDFQLNVNFVNFLSIFKSGCQLLYAVMLQSYIFVSLI